MYRDMGLAAQTLSHPAHGALRRAGTGSAFAYAGTPTAGVALAAYAAAAWPSSPTGLWTGACCHERGGICPSAPSSPTCFNRFILPFSPAPCALPPAGLAGAAYAALQADAPSTSVAARPTAEADGPPARPRRSCSPVMTPRHGDEGKITSPMPRGSPAT